jgi:hypothetical protein
MVLSTRHIYFIFVFHYFSRLEEYLKASQFLDKEDIVLRAESGLDAKDKELLKNIDNKKLVELGKIALRKNDKRLLSNVAEEISKRILGGAFINDDHVVDILEKAKVATLEHIKRVALKDPSVLVKSDLNLDERIKVLKSLPDERAAEALAKLVKYTKNEFEIDKIISNIDPSLLWAIKTNPYRGPKARLFSAAVKAARSLRESLIYAETGEMGRAEMAIYLAERSLDDCKEVDNIKIGSLSADSVRAMATIAIDVVNLLQEGRGEISDLLEKILLRLGVHRGMTLLRSLYRKADPYIKKQIVQIASNYLYRFSSREGLRLLPKKVKSLASPGRVSVKDSVFRIIRVAEDPLVYLRRLKSRSISLALDLSGSMLEYSMWAISIAVLFARNIEKLTLFSHEVKSLRGPFTRSQLAELLLSLEFKGYTDVYNAILEACDTRSRKVVFVSDIKQTVKSGDPVTAIKDGCKKESKIVFIVPPTHDNVLRHRLELAGAKVVTVYKPEDVPKRVLRFLLR